MTEVKTVKETKELLVFLFALGKVAKEAKANDGKVNYLDTILLMKLLPLVGPALEHVEDVPAEFKDIDSMELSELTTLIGVEVVGLTDKAKLIEQINAGLALAKALLTFVKTL